MSVFSGVSNPGLIFVNLTADETALVVALGLLPIDATKAIVKSGATSLSQVSIVGNSVETPTGSVNGVNASFTVTAEPKWVVSDNMVYFDGAGYTYAALGITMDIPPSFMIRAII